MATDALTLTGSIACFRTRKLLETQVSLKITVVGDIIQAKDYYCFGGIRCVWIHLEYQQTREERWGAFEARETGRNAIKHYLPFKIRTIRTIQFNSDVATSRRPHKHGNILLLFAWANEGDGLKTNIRSLTALLCIHWKEPYTQRIIAA